jgi:uncharacterized GH25 family protein
VRPTLFTTTFLLLSTVALQAHWPWLEPGTAADPARAYFGVYPAERMGGPQVNAMMAARFWSVDAKGTFQPLTPQAESNGLQLGAHDGVIMSYPFGVYAGHGPASLIIFSAKAFRGSLATSSPEVLPLDILPVQNAAVQRGKASTFRLLRNGKPLAGTTVFAYTPAQGETHSAVLKAAKAAGHDHAHEGKHAARKEGSGEIPSNALKASTNEKGEFTLTVPDAGSYQMHVTVREATPGTHNGKAYETVTLVSTFRFEAR